MHLAQVLPLARDLNLSLVIQIILTEKWCNANMSENLNEHKHYTILQWNFYMVETELENLARETRS